MKFLNPLVLGLLLSYPIFSRAEDLSNRFGISGILGAGFPLGPEDVTSITDDVGLGLGVQGSFYVSPHIGIGVSYENIELGNGQRISPIDMLMLFRLYADRSWTPTFLLGGGSARGTNSDRMDNVNLKTGIGVEWFMSPAFTVGPQLNYYFISNSGGATSEAHILGLNVLATYYFGPTN
jgi:hypothetical protein